MELQKNVKDQIDGQDKKWQNFENSKKIKLIRDSSRRNTDNTCLII